jgi:hypothetical protein
MKSVVDTSKEMEYPSHLLSLRTTMMLWMPDTLQHTFTAFFDGTIWISFAAIILSAI